MNSVKKGHEEKPPPTHIRCDTKPYVLDGCTIEEHQKGEKIKISSLKEIEFYFSKNQQKKGEEGNALRKKLETLPAKFGKKVLNANVLDFLLKRENWHLIPEEWKKRDKDGNIICILFWGTIYKRYDGCLFVAGLCFYRDKWERCFNWLNIDFNSQRPAAIAGINSVNKKAQS